MTSSLGEYLVKADRISRTQLNLALKQQLNHGQEIGDSLVALGYLSADEMTGFMKKALPAPKTLEETGLDLLFIADLVLKHALFLGEFGLQEPALKIGLPRSLVENALDLLRREKLVEVTGAAQITKATFRFKLTEQGKHRASELFRRCAYCGPAPVPLKRYCEMVELQNIRNVLLDKEMLQRCLAHLTLAEEIYQQLGPAFCSGQPIFLYGPPGNGKTSIAMAISQALPGTVYIPYSLLVDGQIIQVFDQVNHVPVKAEEDPNRDHRWLEIKRPVIMSGGELTLKMLDLQFNPITGTYQAPLQMKANNGILVIDDFGRQQIDPQDLLNRWIVCMERNLDFLTLHTGLKFTIPFNQILLFSTNLRPQSLMDEAFLRRIRYKIKVDQPSEWVFKEIFRRVCENNGLEFNNETFDFLMRQCYDRHRIRPSACQPRDLVAHIMDHCRYHRQIPKFIPTLLKQAWETYFLLDEKEPDLAESTS